MEFTAIHLCHAVGKATVEKQQHYQVQGWTRRCTLSGVLDYATTVLPGSAARLQNERWYPGAIRPNP
jgi:hypothetical protein